jgi:pimeloyl-ACP methyl ester carboxylesterase
MHFILSQERNMPGQVTTTTLNIPEPAIADLRERLARTRSPDQAPGPAWAVQGGDWGAITASRLGYAHPDKLIGIHVYLLAIRYERDASIPATAEEAKYYKEVAQWLREETGYQWIQGTKPQTLAFALTDSPAGLAAWIVEKFRTWSDCVGNVESVFSRYQLLANISFYWFTGAIASSFWPYYARLHRLLPIPDGHTVDVSVGYSEFPREILRMPRSLAVRTYRDVRRWTTIPRGGHFAAMEQPEALDHEVQAFFRPLRG